MKALSLYQPWATLVLLGWKRHETRGWRTGHRGWLLIHAARKMPAAACELFGNATVRELLAAAGIRQERHLPRGVLLGAVRLAGCQRTEDADAAALTAMDRLLGDYSPGRWIWSLEDPRPLAVPV